MPVRLITANYQASSTFVIPEGVFLLDEWDNAQADMKTLGSWWIKWDTLYYVAGLQGESVILKEIQGVQDEGERKRPESVEVEEGD